MPDPGLTDEKTDEITITVLAVAQGLDSQALMQGAVLSSLRCLPLRHINQRRRRNSKM